MCLFIYLFIYLQYRALGSDNWKEEVRFFFWSNISTSSFVLYVRTTYIDMNFLLWGREEGREGRRDITYVQIPVFIFSFKFVLVIVLGRRRWIRLLSCKCFRKVQATGVWRISTQLGIFSKTIVRRRAFAVFILFLWSFRRRKLMRSVFLV